MRTPFRAVAAGGGNCGAFAGAATWDHVTSVRIGRNIDTIGANAFSGSPSADRIYIDDFLNPTEFPASVVTIGAGDGAATPLSRTGTA